MVFHKSSCHHLLTVDWFSWKRLELCPTHPNHSSTEGVSVSPSKGAGLCFQDSLGRVYPCFTGKGARCLYLAFPGFSPCSALEEGVDQSIYSDIPGKAALRFALDGLVFLCLFLVFSLSSGLFLGLALVWFWSWPGCAVVTFDSGLSRSHIQVFREFCSKIELNKI